MDRRACKVVMDRWQEMLVVNKMGSLGFGGSSQAVPGALMDGNEGYFLR